MAGIDLSTAGVTLMYAVELTAGTRPTTGYTKMPGVKSVPSFNPAPETLESTTLEATEWKTYVSGLKDPGGALSYMFNLNDVFKETWQDAVDEFKTASASGKAMWWTSVIPGMKESFYFAGEPSSLGQPEMGVSAILEVEAFITPIGEGVWAAKPIASI